MDESLGDIRIPRMILTQTVLTLGSVAICYWNSGPHHTLPSILDIAKIYPNSIIFRVGMLYSMFILFLVNLFVSWWLQGANEKLGANRKRLISHIWVALFSTVMYALFVSCVDNKRINYSLASLCVSWAAIGFGFLIDSITWNISKMRSADPNFIKGKSWKVKKFHTAINLFLQIYTLLIFTGQVEIQHKVLLEYLMLVNVTLYFFSFRIDFKKCKMGVQIDEWGQQQNQEPTLMIN